MHISERRDLRAYLSRCSFLQVKNYHEEVETKVILHQVLYLVDVVINLQFLCGKGVPIMEGK